MWKSPRLVARLLLLLLVAVALLSSGRAGAQSAAPAGKSEAAPQTKEETPAQLFKALEEAQTEEAAHKAVDRLLAHPQATPSQKGQARSTKVALLFMAARKDPAARKGMDDFIAQVAKDDPSSEAAANGRGYQWALDHLLVAESPPDALPKLVAYAQAHPQHRLGLQLFAAYARKLESLEVRQAVGILQRGAEVYAKHPDGQVLRSSLTRLEGILAKPMELDGPTLSGKPIDLADLRGKVVLVDFWATWCGPCVAELPTVKQVYQKYHGQGFEIVGISLDQDIEDLRTFVKEESIPWPQIIFAKAEDRGWDSPLARKFEVKSIPATFLVDRKGSVLALNVRGEGVAAAVQKALAAKPDDGPSQ